MAGDDFTNGLLDDDAFDPKKLFDEKHYSTLIVNREGFSKKQNETADLIEALLEPRITRQEADAIYSRLKDTTAQPLLVELIGNTDNLPDKKLLVAACWECGLDFSEHLLFFTQLACHSDFGLAMEALTVVQTSEGKVEQSTLLAALNTIAASKSPHAQLLNELSETLKSRIH